MQRVRRALLSVSDKRGLVDLARALVGHGVELLSTGGTFAALAGSGLPVTQVSEHTGAPEILDGRVKTLHPRIHGGLLGRPTPEHEAEMAANGIEPIDLVVVNLYPFAATIAKAGSSFADAIENIDIGGPAMLRSAAKNHERVTVVVDPDDYGALVALLAEHGGAVPAEHRLAMARKAFAHTAAYDAAIAAYLSSIDPAVALEPAQVPTRRPFPDVIGGQWRKLYDLRYGENPHQAAAFYEEGASPLPGWPARRPTLARADVLGGKQLSYNNLLDLDAALRLALELDDTAAVVVKHNNPCGVAHGGTLAEAYTRARAADPVSAFGGIVALNRVVDGATARLLAETFLECVIAPELDDEARAVLAGKKNLRLVRAAGDWRPTAPGGGPAPLVLRAVAGGVLAQTADTGRVDLSTARVATRRAPSAGELADLEFAWRVAKHVKSNAIVFARDGVTLAIGAGQMSRVDSVKICELKAGSALAGSAVASDAFFPFRDGLDVLARAGATAVVQPGGSVRDDEVIAAADEHGLAMVLTGMRHFLH
jgi:phosphoribosylaminoimidazolecarboxamide formyltransferase/IMP cyclohydrolase